MTAGFPEGLDIEEVYLVEVPYTPQAAERRPAVRPQHLERVARLIRDGVLIEGGGCLDFSRSILLLRVADEAAAAELIATDVYTAAGVWAAPTIRRFGRVTLAR